MTLSDLKKRLENAFLDAYVEVQDLTGTEDHYQVSIISKVFTGKSLIQQQRMVMNVFDPELKTGELHALSIKTGIPSSGE